MNEFEDNNRLSYQNVLGALLRQKWIIAAFTTCVLLLTVATTWMATPMYLSTAVVEVVPKQSHEMRGQSLLAPQPVGSLYLNQQFYRTETDKILSLSSRKRIAERYTTELGYSDLENRGAAKLLGMLTVAPRSNSRLINISVSHAEPEKAAILANLTAQVYQERNLSFRQKSANEAQEWLAAQLSEYKTRIEGSSRALVEFRAMNDLGDVEETRSMLASQFAEYSSGFATISSDRLQLESDIAVQERLINKGSYDELAKIVTSKLVDELASNYASARSEHENVAVSFGEKHPTFKKSSAKMMAYEEQLKRELNRQLRADKSRLSMLKAKENTLSTQIGSLKDNLLTKQKLLAEHQDLEDQVRHNRKFHDKLVQRLDELKLEARTQLNNVTIIDQAEQASAPYSPRWLINLFMGLVVGLGGGVLVGLGKDYLDDTLRSPTDIAAYLNTPYLGLIPEVRGNMSRSERGMYTVTNPLSTTSEAVRSIRAMLEVQLGSSKHLNLMITSAAAAEGKTATVVWLGIAFAQLGKRVLLVDADLRRPQLHNVFDLEMKTGLTMVLSGRQAMSDVVCHTEITGLDVLVAGPPVDHPNELLQSPMLDQLRAAWANDYDMVIFDTPPVSAVADALVLARKVDGVALVVRAQAHRRSLIRHTVDRLEQVQARMLGIVLNAVNTEGTNYYRYQYYYGRGDEDSNDSTSSTTAAK